MSKAIANGYALSALVGSDCCRSGAEKVFATGSFWFSAAAQTAALSTLEVYYILTINLFTLTLYQILQ